MSEVSELASETVPPNLKGWIRVSPVATVKEDQTFRIRTRGRLYRYYLLWITELPEGGKVIGKSLGLEK